jgi:hypothetical protein
MKKLCVTACAAIAAASSAFAEETTLWKSLQANCGKAFEGKVVEDTEPNDTWGKAALVMHIRECSADQVKVPLHLNEDRSRVWIVTKLPGGGMRLKHDHRHADGKPDAVTMYGGETATATGDWITFPVDAESIATFKATGLDASVTNSWHLGATDTSFHYKLTRPSGRAFEIEFDLTKPVETPPPAWDQVE